MKTKYFHYVCPSCSFTKFAGEHFCQATCPSCENTFIIRKCNCLTEDQEKTCGGCENPVLLPPPSSLELECEGVAPGSSCIVRIINWLIFKGKEPCPHPDDISSDDDRKIAFEGSYCKMPSAEDTGRSTSQDP